MSDLPTVAEAQANVEKAAQELDALFGGTVRRWTLDGKRITDQAAFALLSLHDYLNDLYNARHPEVLGAPVPSGGAAGEPGGTG